MLKVNIQCLVLIFKCYVVVTFCVGLQQSCLDGLLETGLEYPWGSSTCPFPGRTVLEYVDIVYCFPCEHDIDYLRPASLVSFSSEMSLPLPVFPPPRHRAQGSWLYLGHVTKHWRGLSILEKGLGVAGYSSWEPVCVRKSEAQHMQYEEAAHHLPLGLL
jgi:hypothetical protein